jgi:hypothetical protein
MVGDARGFDFHEAEPPGKQPIPEDLRQVREEQGPVGGHEEIDWTEEDEEISRKVFEELNAEEAARRAAGRKKWHRS